MQNREPSCLQRFRIQMANHPLQGWFVAVGIQSVVSALLLWFFPDARKPGMIFLFACFALGSPTGTLLRRFASAERSKNPISPRQENAVGIFALAASLCSIAALLTLVFGKRVGITIPESTRMLFLFVYAVSLIIALTFGIAGQRTKTGLIGFWIAVVWFGLLVTSSIVIFAVRQYV